MAGNSDIPLIGPIIRGIFGTRNERFVKRYNTRAAEIGALEPRMRAMTDAQLRGVVAGLRDRVRTSGLGGGDEVMVEAFAAAREAMDRSVGIRNAFNPKFREQFAKDKLPADMRGVYERLMAEMDAAEPKPPTAEFLGCTEAQPGWVWTEIPPEFYEAVRAVYPQSKPPFRARPFDVQLIGAMVLYGGKISEMKTGEGKTIVAPLACYLAAIEGYKLHVVTVNDYLVQRDRDWTFPYFHALGLTVGAIHPMHMQDEDIKRDMYRCDVIYGTTAEFGFDYLRDNMKRSADSQVQRVREFAVVDEVDSTLIDEARTPLIISGQAHDDAPRYDLADQLARHLVQMNKPWDEADKKVDECKKLIKGTEGDIRNARDKSSVPALQQKLSEAKARLPQLESERDKNTRYFEIERERKQAHLTHHGVVEAQRKADIGSFYVGENMDMPHLLEQALRAHVIYELDVDYVVMNVPDQYTGRSDPGIVIVDVNTGRPMVGRQWSDGLHQAVEAKEGVRIKPETQTVASITIQNFFKMYKRLAGMTGTADTEAQEFNDIYKLDVVVIPTNVQVVRRDFEDVVYLTAKDKWNSIVDEIKAFNDIGRPVLVGTTSVEKSEMLSKMLASKHNIRHEVLNAKQHEREAHIVESAGQLGAVMIATNMAGRGTDIKLGKVTREALLDHWLRRGIAPRELTIDASDEQVRELVYRKVGPKELDLQKREVEIMPFDELELKLLRKWAMGHTFADPKQIEKMSAEQLRTELDAQGRFSLHRIGWVDSVEQLGGLHVIGTERHESRRIDNQLRGRSGRQGDRGSSRFFVSLEDELMKLFAGDTTMKVLSRLGMKEGDAIEHPMLSKSIVRAQRKVEERNFQIRKNILEYDEVMEHQRQSFYGTRQRVLDGRDLKGLIFDFVEDAAADAVERFLDKDYFAESASEFVLSRLNFSIPHERLRGRDKEDLIEFVRKEAKHEARHEIEITLGEYMPEGVAAEDIDTKGLSSWAATRFKVELTADDIRRMSIREVSNRLYEAAVSRINETDLDDIDQYLVKNYGAQQLAKWLKTTIDLDFTADEIAAKEKHEDVVEMVAQRVREQYKKREVEYPVDFQMQLTMGLMRQSPQGALQNLVNWANTRYNLGWTEEKIRTTPPQKIRDELVAASREFLEHDKLDKAVAEAVAITDGAEANRYFKEKYKVELPPYILRLKGDDLAAQVKARVEAVLRSEQVQFERYVMLEVLDSAWKDHLYAMDQLRDTINYRGYAQQDPRIEYKREGSRLFREFMAKIRDRVAEYIFKLRLMPQVGPPPGAPPMQAAPRPAGAASAPAPAPAPAARPAGPARVVPFGGGTISGPGL